MTGTRDMAQAARDYRRIAAAIDFLQAHAVEQPALADAAAAAHMSEYHFQRLFRRWAGISPKRFVQYLTVEHAKRALAGSLSVLEAAFDSGLSGPGRLHDLFVGCEAMTPGEYKALGAGLEIAYGYHPCPFGECLLFVTGRGVCGLAFVDGVAERAAALADLGAQWANATLRPDPATTGPVADRIFGTARPGAGGIRLLLKGTNFQIRVWEALMRIPPGAVTSYTALAAAVGAPTAARAVGAAVGRNAVSYLVPCHRVIHASGAVTRYRWGPVRKHALLAWEAARQDAA
jgi:AraC family transcriptional regulator of adaptative response/methylated-DNA-[protein]-cysteine methyltransferase